MKSIFNNLINRVDQKFRSSFGPPEYKRLIEPEIALERIFPDCTDTLTDFESEINQVLISLKDDIDFPSTSDVTLIRLTYSIIRIMRPLNVIETGVWIGSSSLTILSALRKNENSAARLHSIDLPPVRTENRVNVGRVVPEELRGNWNLHLGASTEILPSLLASIPLLDLFIHDSDHTYRNITFELKTVWPFLRQGGVIIVDDAHTNHAALDFAAAVNYEPILVKRQKGGCIAIIRK